jgi:hypothetical protein
MRVVAAAVLDAGDRVIQLLRQLARLAAIDQ